MIKTAAATMNLPISSPSTNEVRADSRGAGVRRVGAQSAFWSNDGLAGSLRRGADGFGEAGRGISAQPAPTLPERLYDARERKGVDLYRAERDTKIRARYLAALERGDYRELPGSDRKSVV